MRPTARRGLLEPSLPPPLSAQFLLFFFCFLFFFFFVSPFLLPPSAGPFTVHTRQCLTSFLFRFVFFFLSFCFCGHRCLRQVKPDICILVCLWSPYVLVTIFHRHLALAAPPTPRSPSSEGSSSSSSTSASVVWSSPAPGDRFGPGDTITGEWQTTQNVVSPSFKLCAGGEDGCGATVWPRGRRERGILPRVFVRPRVPLLLLAPSHPRFF